MDLRPTDAHNSELSSYYEDFRTAYSSLPENDRQTNLNKCREQIEKLKNLYGDSYSNNPDASALLSYMILESSRIPAILRLDGANCGLKHQDRKYWDKTLIKEGLLELENSAKGNSVSIYHLRAAVSACHSLAKTWRATDWKQILSIYDNYLIVNKSVEIAFERAEVISNYKGARAEAKAIEEILNDYEIQDKQKTFDKLGDIYSRLHEYKKALASFKNAAALAQSKKDKSFYKKKIQYCKMRINFKDKYTLELSF